MIPRKVAISELVDLEERKDKMYWRFMSEGVVRNLPGSLAATLAAMPVVMLPPPDGGIVGVDVASTALAFPTGGRIAFALPF